MLDLSKVNDGVTARFQTLRYSNLSSQCIVGSDFFTTDCLGADFRGSDVSYSNFTGANLDHARMKGTIAKGCVLAYTTLRYADLTDVNLTGCVDVGADYANATLHRTTLPEGWTYEQFVNEVVPYFFALSDATPKSIVSDKGWASGPIEIAYPNGVPSALEPIERRARMLIASGHLRQAMVKKAFKDAGMLRKVTV